MTPDGTNFSQSGKRVQTQEVAGLINKALNKVQRGKRQTHACQSHGKSHQSLKEGVPVGSLKLIQVPDTMDHT